MVEKDCGERRWGETVVSVVSVCVLYGWFFLVHGHFAEEKKSETDVPCLCRTPKQTYLMSNECNR